METLREELEENPNLDEKRRVCIQEDMEKTNKKLDTLRD